MRKPINYRDYSVLFVDERDEELIAYGKRLGNIFSILTTDSQDESFHLLENTINIAVVVYNQDMARNSGTKFLARLRDLHPEVIRILLTDADSDVAIDAINMGIIYKYLLKPCKYDILKIELMRAIDQYCLEIERINLLEERIGLEKLSTIGELAGGFAHEIRNPVAVISLNAEISLSRICEKPIPMDKLKRSLNEIINQCQRLSRAIDHIMEFARPDRANYEPIRLDTLIGRSIFLFREEISLGDIDIITEIPNDLPVIYGDRIQLEQVFINLLRNSYNSMQGKGIAYLKGKHNPKGKEIIIELKDNGPGISKEDFRHLLKQFFTHKQDGSGIGFYICNKIIESHGGKMIADYECGEGNLIRINLPIKKHVSYMPSEIF